MKKVLIFIIVFAILAISIIFGIKLYNYYRIKNAKIEVTLVDDLTLEFNDKKKISDFIIDINGTIIDDKIIDSTILGKKNIKFDFINDDNIKVSYNFDINIIDTVSPLIWLGDSYTIQKDSDINLTEKILCGDNYDSKPNCYIDGNYDISKVGSYELVFNAIDSSGNKESKEFTLNIIEPIKNSTSVKKESTYTNFSEIIEKYKNDNTKIGIDVSSWQGDIDFEKIKNSGVEFIIIRVGGTKGTNGEYFLDSKFENNIKKANEYGIDVGLYFYSYADSLMGAKKDAKWVLKQIKNYKVDLPIAFDWEEWSYFNEYNLSFFGLTSMANTFLDTLKENGYEGMLYSSKTYLENIWMDTDYDIWLAHYVDKTSYEGKYKFWQICDNGKIDGINGAVDIDIMYKK